MNAADMNAFRHVHRIGRPSAEQSKELMAAVMRVAREEFAAKGFHNATMDVIAARAGVSKRTLYAWHADKAALLHAAIMDRAAELTEYVIDPKADLKDAIAAYSRAALKEVSSDYSMSVGALIMREARQFPLAGQAMQQGQEYLRRPLVTLLRHLGMTTGEADSIGKLYIASLLSELTLRMIMGQPAQSPDQIRRHVGLVVSMFMPGLEERLHQLSMKTEQLSPASSH